MEDLNAILRWHSAHFPAMEVQDAVKLLYQRFFGSEHLVADERDVLPRLEAEWADCGAAPNGAAAPGLPPGCQPLGNGLCRMELSACRALGVSVRTAARLFLLTARAVRPDPAGFQQALDALASNPRFAHPDAKRFLTGYRSAGCPALHHSPAYRAAYRPAYRLIRVEYARLLPALGAIDRLPPEPAPQIIALDGPCASGKTTAGLALARIYDCPLVHMDDFFLRPEQRSPQRLAVPGGNVDYERFDAQVLAPLRAGVAARYRPWDCRSLSFGEEITIPPAPRVVVEGSYSLHPALRARYSLPVWVQADAGIRRRRLLARCGPDGLARFESLWIPLEEAYFSACGVLSACRIRLDLSSE